MLFFLYIFAANNFRVPKTGHLISMILLSILVMLFLFSAFLFIFLGKTSQSATLTEFISDFNPRTSASIVVDLSNTTLTGAQAMQSCAGKLANTLTEKNKTWTIYALTPTTCTITRSFGNSSSATPAQCVQNASTSDSYFRLGYSDLTDIMRFSIIYKNKAEISADKDYYETCPLTTIFG